MVLVFMVNFLPLQVYFLGKMKGDETAAFWNVSTAHGSDRGHGDVPELALGQQLPGSRSSVTRAHQGWFCQGLDSKAVWPSSPLSTARQVNL